MKRSALFISDSTGMTASALGKLLEHFPQTVFTQVRIPFTDTPEKIDIAKNAILQAKQQDGIRPIVIMSLGNIELRNSLKQSDAYFVDLFSTFIDPLGIELGEQPLTGSGIAHGIMGSSYSDRMEAINFTLNHDDLALLFLWRLPYRFFIIFCFFMHPRMKLFLEKAAWKRNPPAVFP